MMKSLQAVIEVHRHGLILKSPPGIRGVPMDAFGASVGAGEHLERHRAGLEDREPDDVYMAPGVANMLGHLYGDRIVTASATEAARDAWEEELLARVEARWPNPIDRWPRGRSVGSSALALWCGLHLTPERRATFPEWWEPSKSTPMDSADLGRCLRALEVFGPDEGSVEFMREVSPMWDALAGVWEELERQHVEGDHAGVRQTIQDARQRSA